MKCSKKCWKKRCFLFWICFFRNHDLGLWKMLQNFIPLVFKNLGRIFRWNVQKNVGKKVVFCFESLFFFSWNHDLGPLKNLTKIFFLFFLKIWAEYSIELFEKMVEKRCFLVLNLFFFETMTWPLKKLAKIFFPACFF